MPYATALTLTVDRALDPTASQNAMRYMNRIAIDAEYNGLALDDAEGERIARAMAGKDVAFLANHGVIVAGGTVAHAYDDLYYLERACLHQVIAQSTGRPLAPVDAKLAAHVAAQIQGEREQSDLFFEALRRMLPAARRLSQRPTPNGAPRQARAGRRPESLYDRCTPAAPRHPRNVARTGLQLFIRFRSSLTKASHKAARMRLPTTYRGIK
jgi:hypothetical protein